MGLTIDERVAAARELLAGWTPAEYERLSTAEQVSLQEAIEYLEGFGAARGERKK